MVKLDLDYLEISQDHPVLEILKSYGGQIATFTNGYLTHITTSGGSLDEINTASLYIIAPDIDKSHQLVTVRFKDANTYNVRIWGLSDKTDDQNVERAINDYSKLDDKIGEMLAIPIAKNALKFLVDQTKLKLESKIK